MGYATEASRALLGKAAETFEGDIFALIHPDNHASQNVARKLGFGFLRRVVIDARLQGLYRLRGFDPTMSASTGS